MTDQTSLGRIPLVQVSIYSCAFSVVNAMRSTKDKSVFEQVFNFTPPTMYLLNNFINVAEAEPYYTPMRITVYTYVHVVKIE